MNERGGSSILVVAGALGLALAAVLAFGPLEENALGPLLRVDATSRLFLIVINTIFLGIAVQARVRAAGARRSWGAIGLTLLFLGAANLTLLSDPLLLGWIALEVTTIAAAPLIVRSGAPDSRLASWRYFLFSTFGLGLAMLGMLCLVRGTGVEGGLGGLTLQALLGAGVEASDPWSRLGLSLVLLGYGTKLGLAPMHLWLPETYDEAPPAVTSMLAAIQFNCALVALIRVLSVFRAGNEDLVSAQLIGMGLASVLLATASLVATTRIRRVVAYSSIVHAGIIAIGLGVGGGAGYGVLLYAVSNAFIKAMLFLTAGKIEAEYGTRETRSIRGVIQSMPYSGLFLMAGTFALLGFPPFGSFLGELLILSGLVRGGYLLTFAALGFLVSVTFMTVGRTVFPMIWGTPEQTTTRRAQTFVSFLPQLLFLVVLVVLGLHLPAPVNALFQEVAVSLGDR